ncbi:MAG: phenylalanine--tRNA ligase subunit alpha [Acidimicrobiia bacterium]|nr:phenylalanine--tRNA ligase subunit alpha [Acidimicrobiia bacterium]MDQ3499706.1 phenylalanine--tRNA ligase subunit alpha [Actinomycetota bacterium]
MELFSTVADALDRIGEVSTTAELDLLDSQILGRNSPIGAIRRQLGQLPVEDRPTAGARLNEAVEQINAALTARRSQLASSEADRLLASDAVDVTAEVWTLRPGNEHLLQRTVDEVCDIFVGLGYRVAEGPEAELAWYNFDALNTPPHHPARAESDTLYVEFGNPADEVLLRTQTSPMQVRYMEKHEPPVYVLVPGKTFRSDAIDATHLPVFHQIEGLAVDENIKFSDLKGTLAHFAREFFGPKQRIRLRPHFFPFTEPSAELDVSCFVCDGTGCKLCGESGWLEMAGCGMVDPNVLDISGYDSRQVSGFAFGMGTERLAMVRHGIADIRVFIENDLRVLRQFR